MSLLRIATVTPLAGQRLRLELTDGTTIEREVGPLLNGPVFKEIREKPELFARVRGRRRHSCVAERRRPVSRCPDLGRSASRRCHCQATTRAAGYPVTSGARTSLIPHAI